MGKQPSLGARRERRDGRSRNRRFSAVSGSADYIFTLLDQSEGSACCGGRKFAIRHGPPPWPQATVVTGSISPAKRLPTVLPSAKTRLGVHRYKPILATAFLPSHPNLRCQTGPSM